nr:pilus assembly protein TadG-related protein [Mesorhizobium loti]
MRILASLNVARRRFLPDRSANFAIMAALSMPIALALMAVAVDEGSLYTERRAAQSVTDLAAIAAGSNIINAEQAVLAAFSDNGLTGATVGAGTPTPGKPVVSVVRGRYTPSSAVGQRFEAGKTPYNAVSVSLKKIGVMYFGGAFMSPPMIGTNAIASTTPQATFSIGSRLAAVDTSSSPLLNSILGGLLGTNIALNAMDYNALIGADINVLSFLDQLAIKLNLTGVSYSNVLASKATLTQIIGAMANIPGLDSRSKLALQTMAAGATNAIKIPLDHLIDLGNVGRLGLGQRPAGLTVDADALSMVKAAANLAGGAKQIDLNTGITVPGLLEVVAKLAVGEPPQSTPWLTVGEKGAKVRTAQTRLKLEVTVGSSNVSSGIKIVSVSIPLNVEVAYAEAELMDITCSTGRPESRKVTIAARPGIVEAYLAKNSSSDFADFTKPQTFGDASIVTANINILGLIKLDLLELRAKAYFYSGNQTTTTLVFDDADITAKRIKKTSTKDFATSLTSSLLTGLELKPYLLGSPIGLLDLVFDPLKTAVVPLLTSVTSQLDAILFNLLSSLGITLGEADVRVTGATCGRSVLVQ